MADLVAEMAQQGPVRFTHVFAHLHPISVVGLQDVDGDQALRMPRQQRRAVDARRQQVEGQAAVIGFRGTADRQPQRHQLRDHLALGGFHLEPERAVVQYGQVGNRPVQAARGAQRIRRMRRQQPIAQGRQREVGAALVGFTARPARFAPCAGRGAFVQRQHVAALGIEAQLPVAIQAFGVGKEYRLAAHALERLRAGMPHALAFRGAQLAVDRVEEIAHASIPVGNSSIGATVTRTSSSCPPPRITPRRGVTSP
ncbi:hypothetical protein D3C71_1151240 [compost metagenome]